MPENIAGDREVPDHPLVKQTIEDCLIEAMDIEGWKICCAGSSANEIECIARDLPEPSPLASEILNARPYAFLDNAPLEERRTHAVHTRRAERFCRETNWEFLMRPPSNAFAKKHGRKRKTRTNCTKQFCNLGVATTKN